MQEENPYESPLETSFDQSQQDSTTSLVAPESRRFVNFILDYIVVQLLAIALYKVMEPSVDIPRLLYDVFVNYNYLFSPVVSIIFLSYYILQEFFWGRTLGKFITGTKVVTADGTSPSFIQIVGRTLCRLIPFDWFSFLEESPIGWHDKLSKTRVVMARSTLVSVP